MSHNEEFHQTRAELEKTLIPILLKGPPPSQYKKVKEKKEKKKNKEVKRFGEKSIKGIKFRKMSQYRLYVTTEAKTP